LSENGSASWLWVQKDGKGGRNVEGKKTGTWTATEKGITINIRGNSCIISETYEHITLVINMICLKKRYLKRIK